MLLTSCCFVLCFNEREKKYRRRSNFYVYQFWHSFRWSVSWLQTVLEGSDIEWERCVDCDLYQRFKGWRSYLTLTFVQSTMFALLSANRIWSELWNQIRPNHHWRRKHCVRNGYKSSCQDFSVQFNMTFKIVAFLRTILQNTDFIRQDTRFVIRHCLCWDYVCVCVCMIWWHFFRHHTQIKICFNRGNQFHSNVIILYFYATFIQKKRVQLRTTYTFIIKRLWQKLK